MKFLGLCLGSYLKVQLDFAFGLYLCFFCLWLKNYFFIGEGASFPELLINFQAVVLFTLNYVALNIKYTPCVHFCCRTTGMN